MTLDLLCLSAAVTLEMFDPLLNMLDGVTGLFGGLRQHPLLNTAEVGTGSYAMRSYALEMVLRSLQQAVISSCPPLQAHASLQHTVKPLALYVVAASLTG